MFFMMLHVFGAIHWFRQEMEWELLNPAIDTDMA